LFGEKGLNRRDLLNPIILKVFGDAKGKYILDAGCRDGYMSHKIPTWGTSVTGVELSQKLLDFAIIEKKKEPLMITYHQADCSSFLFLSDRTFDSVVTDNGIQDVADYQGAIQRIQPSFKIWRNLPAYRESSLFHDASFWMVKDDKGKTLQES
jgi:2-polyprenyl-3-methyl-5-hydroxy-6-metoxy-1,4-benzoquinol methylase